MFERFAKDARAAVVGAQEVARDTGSRSIDTRHLLLVLAEQPGRRTALSGRSGPTWRRSPRPCVPTCGPAPGRRRAGGPGHRPGRRTPPGGCGLRARLTGAGGTAPAGHIPFTPDAKKALELALREAIRLKQKRIHTGHLMLGILRADSAGQALLQRGAGGHRRPPHGARGANEGRLKALRRLRRGATLHLLQVGDGATRHREHLLRGRQGRRRIRRTRRTEGTPGFPELPPEGS